MCVEDSLRMQAYAEYLMSQNIPVESIEQRLVLIREFIEFIATGQPVSDTAGNGKRALAQFAQKLITEGRNILENFNNLANYADWIGDRQMYVNLIELTDCHNALAVLADLIERQHGRELRKWIFDEPLPALGADESMRCAYTRRMTQRMAAKMAPVKARAAWFKVQHGIPPEAWRDGDLADRQKYERCGNIDTFLDLKRKERNDLLTHLHDEGRLWYTIEITDEVLAFITSDPEMEGGRREGNEIYITKVPYNAARYLRTNNPQMKRYYACHCPLVREAIRNNESISPEICSCSLGHASHYLAGLGVDLKGEVLESAVMGNDRCRFVFHLPACLAMDHPSPLKDSV